MAQAQAAKAADKFTVVNRIAVPDKKRGEIIFEVGQEVASTDLGKSADAFAKNGDVVPVAGAES